MSDSPITATLNRIAEAWNAGDGSAYGAEFTDDATYVTFAGDVLRGRTAIAETHLFLLVDGGVRLDGQEHLSGDRASTVSFVLRRAGERWEIAAFQNTRDA